VTDNQKQVDQLLTKYEEYKAMMKLEASSSLKVAKAKLTGAIDEKMLRDYKQLKARLQELSDKMTFANPIIWMMYKYEAYKDEAQPIRTMHDFRVHCSKQGYICTKRFNFLNEQLLQRGNKSLKDVDEYHDDMLLAKLFTQKSIIELTSNSEFMKLWEVYEYNRVAGQPAKWVNYS
jgi:hypothetical protein